MTRTIFAGFIGAVIWMGLVDFVNQYSPAICKATYLGKETQ